MCVRYHCNTFAHIPQTLEGFWHGLKWLCFSWKWMKFLLMVQCVFIVWVLQWLVRLVQCCFYLSSILNPSRFHFSMNVPVRACVFIRCPARLHLVPSCFLLISFPSARSQRYARDVAEFKQDAACSSGNRRGSRISPPYMNVVSWVGCVWAVEFGEMVEDVCRRGQMSVTCSWIWGACMYTHGSETCWFVLLISLPRGHREKKQSSGVDTFRK